MMGSFLCGIEGRFNTCNAESFGISYFLGLMSSVTKQKQMCFQWTIIFGNSNDMHWLANKMVIGFKFQTAFSATFSVHNNKKTCHFYPESVQKSIKHDSWCCNLFILAVFFATQLDCLYKATTNWKQGGPKNQYTIGMINQIFCSTSPKLGWDQC